MSVYTRFCTWTIRKATMVTSVRSLASARWTSSQLNPILNEPIQMKPRCISIPLVSRVSTDVCKLIRRSFISKSNDELGSLNDQKKRWKSKFINKNNGTIQEIGKKDGLPKYHSKREAKMEYLYSLVEQDIKVLITAPPQSGKSAMSKLFVDFVKAKHPDVPVYFISFTDFFNENNKIFKDLSNHLKDTIGLTLREFISKVVDNKKQKCIVVLDESQKIWHIGEFWGMFKYPATCSLLAFSLFPADDKRRNPGFGAPFSFDYRLSYPFVAFTRAEFEEVANQFKRNYQNRVDDNAISFIAEQVKCDYREEETEKLTTMYHPGLTYVCFTHFLTYPPDEKATDIICDLKTGNTLYNRVYDYARCFASLYDFKTIFRNQVIRLTGHAPESDYVREKVDNFDQMFLRTLHLLFARQEIEFKDPIIITIDETILLDILVRYGYCCRRYSGVGKATNAIYLSCPLVQTHIHNEMLNYEWSRKGPQSHYSSTSLKQYAIDVISRFDPESLQAYQKSKYHDRIFESGNDDDFGTVAKSDPKAKNTSNFVLDHEQSIKGQVDFILKGKDDKGIKLVYDWNTIQEHLETSDNKSQNLKDVLTIYFHENEMPNPSQVKDLLNKINEKHLSKLLIANFVDNFEKVIFYEVTDQRELRQVGGLNIFKRSKSNSISKIKEKYPNPTLKHFQLGK